MKKNILIIVLFSFSMTLLAQDPNAREIVEKSQVATQISGLEAKSRLEIHDGKGHVRIRETSMASRLFPDGTEKRVIIFLSPPEVRGTGMLILDYPTKEDDLWIYMPSLHKTRKIVSTEKASSFMGSEFSNSDLTMGNLDDFNYAMDGEEMVKGVKCWRLRLTPINDKIKIEYNISTKILWICQSDYVPRQAKYLDKDNKPWKEMSYDQIKKLDPVHGKYIVTSMEIRNLKNNRFSIMEMQDVVFNPDVKERYFTTLFLEQQ